MYLPPMEVHVPRPSVPCQGFEVREEVRGHVFQSGGCNYHRYLLSEAVTLWHRQVNVRIAVHQKLSPVGAIDDVCDDALNV